MGRKHGCAIDAVGDLRCWGGGDASFSQAPRLVRGPFAHVEVVDDCSCALRRDRSVQCFGASRASCPAMLTGSAGMRTFSLSSSYMLLVDRQGNLSCVGDASQPGCVSRSFSQPVMAVVAAGRSSCVLLDSGGLEAGDGSVGGNAVCFTPNGMVNRTGRFGSLAAVGPGTFCALAGSSSTTLQPGAMQCWGDSASALLNGLSSVVGPYRHLSSSYHDPVIYGVDLATGSLQSWDAEYDASRGCGGARCACAPGSQACALRSAARAAPGVTYALAPVTTGIGSPAAYYTCGLGCDMGVKCFGPDAANPLLAVPAWVSLPCAMAVPEDVTTDLGASQPLQCVLTEEYAIASEATSSRQGMCNIRGWWNNGTILIDQLGVTATMFPRNASFGTISYAQYAATGKPAVLGVRNTFTVRNYNAARSVLKASGTVSNDCTRIIMADGSRWDVTQRCAVRYIRVYRGAFTGPSVEPGIDGMPMYPDVGQPALWLGDVAVYDDQGVNIAPFAQLKASSLSPACGEGNASACLASAVDGDAMTAFMTAWAWGNYTATDPFGWLQLDFGTERYISRIVLSAGGVFPGEPDRVHVAMMSGVRVHGFDDRSPLASGPLNATAARLLPAFEYRVARGAAFAMTGDYEFSDVQRWCGNDPRASESPSPTPSQTGSSSASASKTPTGSTTASSSGTASVTPTRSTTASLTASLTGTVSATSSITNTPSKTSSITMTPSATASSLPAAFRNSSQVISELDAVTRSGSSRLPRAYDWRTNPSLVSLAEAPDSDYQASTHTVQLAWEPFEDVGSGIAAVAYCLGTAQFRCNLRGWTRTASVKSSVDFAVVTDLVIPAGTVVYASVAAVNYVGLVSMSSSDGVYVDDRPPQVSRVVDTGKYFLHPEAISGAGTVVYTRPADINCDEEGAGIGAAWRDAVALAGIGYYEWSVGTAPNASDILPWTNLGTAFAVYNSSLFIPAGLTYFVSVRSTGLNGLRDYGFSNGVTVLDRNEAQRRMLCVQGSDAARQTTGTSPAPSAQPRNVSLSVAFGDGQTGSVSCRTAGILGALVCM